MEEALGIMIEEMEGPRRPRTSAQRTSRNPSLASLQQTDEGLAYRAECREIISAMRQPSPYNSKSPLLALQQQVTNVFKHGPERATGIFHSLSQAAKLGSTKAQFPYKDLRMSWNSCKASATLVGLLACPPSRLHEVAKFMSHDLGGLPKLEEIRNTSSASLQDAFRHAKALARGEKGICSVITVSLTDVHIFELAQKRCRGGSEADKFTTFAHSFVLGVGPEGIIIWQSWGEHGYGLDKWMNDGRARVRTWQEAGDLVSVFETFVAYKVS
jgi:hypothetical protein